MKIERNRAPDVQGNQEQMGALPGKVKVGDAEVKGKAAKGTPGGKGKKSKGSAKKV